MKSRIYSLPLCLVVVCTLFAGDQPRITAIVGGTLVNSDGSPPSENSIILVEDSIITAVGLIDEIAVPQDAHVLDANGKWVIPGLIDSHVHFFQSGGLYTRPDVIDLRHIVPYEDRELRWIRDNLSDTFARYLRSGVTSVVDMGGPMWNFDVRRTAAERRPAPRVIVAGPLISTYQPDALTTADPPIVEVATTEEARQLVRIQAGQNTDLIKVWFIVTRGRSLQDGLPIVEAVIDESRKHGLRVAVHATQLETARAAVRAGADILVHSVTDQIVDQEFVSLLRENNVIYIPTLTVFERYPMVFNQRVNLTIPEFHYAHPEIVASLFHLRGLGEESLPPWIHQRLRNPQAIPDDRIELQNLRILHEGGVTIAAGTDAGNIGTFHGPSIFREFQLMSRAGMSSIDILKSATRSGAEVMGKTDVLGTVAPGKLADMVLLNSDPLHDIMNTSDIYAVIADGEIFFPSDLVPVKPEDIVQKQVNAYNARDIDAFVSFYHPEATVYRFPDHVLASGWKEIYERYQRRFSEAPRLHCEIINRIVSGDFVIDEEVITGLPDEGIIEAVVIYEVSDGYIVNSWIIVAD